MSDTRCDYAHTVHGTTRWCQLPADHSGPHDDTERTLLGEIMPRRPVPRVKLYWGDRVNGRDNYIVRNHSGRVAREDRREARRMGWDDD